MAFLSALLEHAVNESNTMMPEYNISFLIFPIFFKDIKLTVFLNNKHEWTNCIRQLLHIQNHEAIIYIFAKEDFN
jgi:hypothetical protein